MVEADFEGLVRPPGPHCRCCFLSSSNVGMYGWQEGTSPCSPCHRDGCSLESFFSHKLR